MARRRTIIILAIVLLFVGGIYAAQKSLKVDVELVMMNVAVTDSDNRPVTDLKAENFQIFEDKVEQQIRYFSMEAAPMSLGIVFDMSHSMERNRTGSKHRVFIISRPDGFCQSGPSRNLYTRRVGRLNESVSRAGRRVPFNSDRPK